MKLNKKGVTLMEIMVVIIVIALLIAMAYPTYTSALEKARAHEAMQLVSHMVAAQDRFRGECYNMVGSQCQYSDDFTRLPLEIRGANEDTNITITPAEITTRAFTYTMDGTGEDTTIIATPRSNSYEYIISARVGDTTILCDSLGTDSGKKICASLGPTPASGNIYTIE